MVDQNKIINESLDEIRTVISNLKRLNYAANVMGMDSLSHDLKFDIDALHHCVNNIQNAHSQCIQEIFKMAEQSSLNMIKGMVATLSQNKLE